MYSKLLQVCIALEPCGYLPASEATGTSGSTSLTLKVLVVTTDAQWEGMGILGRQGMSRHYFLMPDHKGF